MSIVDGVGDAQKYYEYNEYGKAEELGNADFINENTFTGAVSEGGDIYYMNARFYDANTGRFLSQDSYKGNAWEPWSQNLYSYVGNNPTNYIDPTGHTPLPIQKIDGGKKYREPNEVITIEIDVKVFFDGDDVSSLNVDLVKDGFNSWSQKYAYDARNYCYYSLILNIEVVTDSNDADLIVYLHAKGGTAHYLQSLEKAGGVGTSLLPDGSSVPTPVKDEIHIYTWGEDWSDAEETFLKYPRHEFGHYLGIADAYETDEYYRDPMAPEDSIMATGMNVTGYDLGIIIGNNYNYNRKKKS